MLASKTAEPIVAILSGMSRVLDAEDLRAVCREDAVHVRVDTVGQVAAGGLLLAIAIVELVLGFWAAGWHHRAVALSVAGFGLAFLTSGIAEIAVGRDFSRIDAPPDRAAR